MDNVIKLKKAYQDFAVGNVEVAMTIFHPDIVWDECTGFPFVIGDGVFKGPEAIDQGVFMKLPEYYEGFKVEIDEIVESGEKIIMIGHYVGIWADTGKAFKANAVHVWTFKGGKAIHYFEAADTAEIINP
jgi:ketosteroid isomerase-like protein